MKKNLIYLCIFGKPEYVKLFNLFTVSLVLSKSKNFSLLVITSKSLEKQIEPILNVLKATLDIHVMLTEEKNSIFSACLARYEIFEFQKIDEFDKILYLDTDILVAKGLDDLFHEEWDQATIHCLPEGKLEDDRDFYGKTLFKEADYLIPDAGIGYSSGVILFRTSEYVKKLFKRIIELAIKDQNNGREFSCYDQPYLNFLASMDQSIHGARIKKYMVNNPKEQNKIMAINHFPGGPGNFESKFSKMSRFTIQLIKREVTAEHWSYAVDQLWLGGKSDSGRINRLSQNIFIIKNDSDQGFIITQPQRQECYYLSIPGFELNDAKILLDTLKLEPVKIPTKIINKNFFDKLLPANADPEKRAIFENKINQDVNQFLSYSYANNKSMMNNGGTVDSFEFDVLQELAKETAQDAGPIIEIGTLFGYSTMALAIGKKSEKPLLTVDDFTWNPIGIPSWRHEEITRKALRYLTETQNVKLIKSSAVEFYKNYKFDPPSLVFIDADHTYEGVSQDIKFAKSVNAAIICGDDFKMPGVKRAVEEHFGDQFEIKGDLWIWKRKNQMN